MLTLKEYKNKLLGCFMGKNIGGTLGAPLEGRNCETFDRFYDFYLQEMTGKPLPNDDLDLQIVWLNALENHKTSLNSRILGEYWLSYIIGDWSEYGAGKGNLSDGILPPLSGVVNNLHKNSCGAFIRSEIWACVAPGHPEIAARFATMDAEVDHADEGIYGEVFCAALESAAFVENDFEKLVDIASSYIPKDCGVRKAVECVKKSYDSGLTWKQAFHELMRCQPSSFSGRKGWTDENGNKIECREIGYDAPGNIGIALIGWYYGEGDFEKSMLITLNCGEDADCTCATLGAVLGVVKGFDAIPEKWIKPIGTDIVTVCLYYQDLTCRRPKTLNELYERTHRLVPAIIGSDYNMETQEIKPAENMYHTGMKTKHKPYIDGEIERNPYKISYEGELFDISVDYREAPFFENNSTKKIGLKIMVNRGRQYWMNIKVMHPDCVTLPAGDEMRVFLYQFYHGLNELEFEIQIGDVNESKLELVMEFSIEGRPNKTYIPLTFLKNTGKWMPKPGRDFYDIQKS